MEHRPTVIIAIRVSSQGQMEEGYGYDAQVRRLPELVEEKGWALARRPDGSAAIYDEGFASTTPEDGAQTSLDHRPVMQKLLGELGYTKPTYLLCRQLDRLYRDPYEHALMMKLLIASGVTAIVEAPTLRSVSLRDLSDPTALLTTDIAAAVAGYFKADQKIKLMMGRQERARQGKPNGGRIPYGYKRPHPKQPFAINEQEAATYRQMVALVIEHQWGSARISHELVKQGRPTRSGAPTWTATTVRRILGSKAQCGYVRARFGGKSSPTEWVKAEGQPAIIDEAEWDRMRAILDARTRESGHNQRRHALAGLLRCSACGMTLKANPDARARRSGEPSRYINYSCRVYNSGCQFGYSISEPRALRELGEWVDARLAATDREGWRTDVVEAEDQVVDVEARLAALTDGLSKAVHMRDRAYGLFVEADEPDREVARAEYDRRRGRVEALSAELDEARQRYGAAMANSSAEVLSLEELRDILGGWRDFPNTEKRMALSALIDHAVLGPPSAKPRLTIVPTPGVAE